MAGIRYLVNPGVCRKAFFAASDLKPVEKLWSRSLRIRLRGRLLGFSCDILVATYGAPSQHCHTMAFAGSRLKLSPRLEVGAGLGKIFYKLIVATISPPPNRLRAASATS